MDLLKIMGWSLALGLALALLVGAEEGPKTGETNPGPGEMDRPAQMETVETRDARPAAFRTEETESPRESHETETGPATESADDSTTLDSPVRGFRPENDPESSHGPEIPAEAEDAPEKDDPSEATESPPSPNASAENEPAETDETSPPDSGGKTPGKASKEKGKPGKAEAKEYPETRNREWIIKMDDEPVAPKTPKVKLAWTNPAQRKKCEGYRTRLRDLFVRTRYYSIQGDACATADHAQAALDLAETCKAECPKGFLKAGGYNDRILRNWGWLRELGSKQCLQ